MRLPLATNVALVALVATAGRVRTQPVARALADCSTASSSSAACVGTVEAPVGDDLTPTQWLFGADPFKELSAPQSNMIAEASTRGQWRASVAALQRPVTAHTAQSATHGSAAGSLSLQDGAPARPGQPTPGESPAAAQRFLIDEWRRAELAVADSVHHVNLIHLAVAFDSAQRTGVRDADRMRILRELDRLNRANQYTWIAFRTEIMRRADSALTLPATPTQTKGRRSDGSS